MPKNRLSRNKNYIRKTKSKKSKNKRKQNQQRKKRQQRGGKIVLPQRYFNPDFQNHYHTQAQLQQSGRVNPGAVSHGMRINNEMIGPDLQSQIGLNNQMGGGVLPAEYFGGSSGRYFEAGSPELQTCTTAYGINVPTSHGVVMAGENAGWMGPNLAPYPNFADMTGGFRRSKRNSKKRNSKKRNSIKKRNNKKRKSIKKRYSSKRK